MALVCKVFMLHFLLVKLRSLRDNKRNAIKSKNDKRRIVNKLNV